MEIHTHVSMVNNTPQKNEHATNLLCSAFETLYLTQFIIKVNLIGTKFIINEKYACLFVSPVYFIPNLKKWTSSAHEPVHMLILLFHLPFLYFLFKYLFGWCAALF